MIKTVQEKIRTASLETLLDIEKIDHTDFIWVNQEIFMDIFYNLELDEYMDEEQFMKIESKSILNWVKDALEKEGYVKVDQHFFATLTCDYKPTEDIDTCIFITPKRYRKLSIQTMNEYGWILKAMAMDTYFKMALGYKNLKDAYQELYEDNGRILEEILASFEYTHVVAKWKYIPKTKELYFYKSEEFYNSWFQGEVDSKFKEYIKSTS